MLRWFLSQLPKRNTAVAVTQQPTEPHVVFHGRKSFLVGTSILVCLYAVSVLYFARSIPDIGLHTAFSRSVNRVDAEQITRVVQGRAPQKKDVIIALDGRPVPTWPDLLRRLAAVGNDGKQEILVQLVPHEDPGRTIEVMCRVDRAAMESLVPAVAWFLLKSLLFLVGVLVFWHRPRDRSAAQFFVLSAVTVGAFMGGYQWWRIATHPILLVVFIVCAVLLPAVTLHFYLIFPRPKRFLERWPRGALLAIYGVPVLFLLRILWGYGATRWLFSEHASATEIQQALDAQLFRIYAYLCVAAAYYLACIVGLVHSFRTAHDATERNQVKWILYGSLAALVPICYSLYLAMWAPDDFGSGAATWPMFAASACFTAAFTISITRYRLMELDQLISSSMVYFLISCVAGLGYYAIVFLAMLLVGSHIFAGPSLEQALLVSTTVMVLTVVRDLIRDRAKKLLDRRFRREKDRLDQTIHEMGKTLERLVDPPALARRVLQASAQLLGVSRGSVFLREGNPPLYRLADSLGAVPPLTELASGCPLVDALQERSVLVLRGTPGGADAAKGQLRFLGGEVSQALTHEGHLLALLVLGVKDAGPYKAEDLNLLAAFAQLTALALENAERHRTIETLNRDLQTKVEKISEQQRRILALQSQLSRTEDRATKSAETRADEKGTAANGSVEIIGTSLAMRQLLQMVRKVAQSPSAVLLRGESGTGKELIAHALHEHSPRAGKPFVKVNCSALAPGLLESELFGHVKGAYTTALKDRVGRFELAHGGTLFLDEIGDISPEVQTKLLRVLQEKTFERVGSSEPVQVDVRVLTATNKDLEALIQQGRFREDLFYRINVISVAVPPLRDRPEDVPELALHFLRWHAQRCGKAVTQIDDDAMVALKTFAWPGNVRQLENMIEHAVVLAEGSTVTLAELAPEVQAALEAVPQAAAAERTRAPEAKRGIEREREQRDLREKERLVRALAAADGNKAEAARALGLARSTLLSRLKKHGLS
jgi:transcriptional regulator with GAF, ATPase, and Fis domain